MLNLNRTLQLQIKIRSSHQSWSVKKVLLEILQNSQENICARVSFLIKLQARPATLLKKRLWHRCFPVNFVKILRTPFYIEHLWWMLLQNFPKGNAKFIFLYNPQKSLVNVCLIININKHCHKKSNCVVL